MPSRSWLARLSIPMMVGAALVTSTAVAVADATDDTFLGKMHTLGFTWPAGDDSDIVAMGHQICADRMAGKRRTRLPQTFTPPWARKASRSQTSHPW